MAERGRRLTKLDDGSPLIIDQEIDKLYDDVNNDNVRDDTLLFQKLKRVVVTATVGASEVGVVHGLGSIPAQIMITMTSTGMVWESIDPDIKKVYLTADGAGRTCKITCIA